MLKDILHYENFSFVFDIQNEKNKFINYGGNLSDFWTDKRDISKQSVINSLRSEELSLKDEFLSILFWGVYFSSVKKNPATTLIKFTNSKNFDVDFNKCKSEIINSDSPFELFKKFQKELKIPGIDYAYFTKLFFFYRLANNKEPYLILDKWLSMAWCAIDGSQNNNSEIFIKYFKSNIDFCFDGVLKRQKPLAYQNYILFMKQISLNQNMDIVTLEEKLFGGNLKQYPDKNPRNLYKQWALQNNIPLNKKNINNTSKSKMNNNNLNSFYLKKTNQYIGLYTDLNYKSKEGYVDNNGWICVSDYLKNILVYLNFNWKKGNTQGGSKEIYKCKFINQKESIDAIKNYINIQNYKEFFEV